MADVVVDASALVDLLLDNTLGRRVGERLAGQVLVAPAHVDAEVLSALGRLHRAGAIDPASVSAALLWLSEAPIRRDPVAALLAGAWSRRGHLRLADAVYVELAQRCGARLVTTDARLRPVALADVVGEG